MLKGENIPFNLRSVFPFLLLKGLAYCPTRDGILGALGVWGGSIQALIPSILGKGLGRINISPDVNIW